MTIIFAVLALIFVYVLIWHTKFVASPLRTMGHNPVASRYAGISNSKMIMIVMIDAVWWPRWHWSRGQ